MINGLDYDLLRKVWALTDSNFDGEARSAFDKTRAIIVGAGGQMRDLPDMLGGGGGSSDAPQNALQTALWAAQNALRTARMEASSARTEAISARMEAALARTDCTIARLERDTARAEVRRLEATLAASKRRGHPAQRAAGRAQANRETLSALRLALREAAWGKLQSDEAYRLWLTTTNPGLDMQLPIDVCIDEAGLQQCISVLGGK